MVTWFGKNIFGTPNYESETESAEVYKKSEEVLRKKIQEGSDIVIEVFWMSNASRDFARSIVEELEANYQQIEVIVVSEKILKNRIEERFTKPDRDSDGDWNVYLKLKEIREESDNSSRFIVSNNLKQKELFLQIDKLIS